MSNSTGGELVLMDKSDPKTNSLVMEFWVICPICETKWIFHGTAMRKERLRDAIGEPVVVTGPSGQVCRGTRVDTSRWGAHALCGTCRAKRAARIVEKELPNKSYVLSYPWKEEDERNLHGRLKHHQDRYRGWAVLVGPWTPEMEMVDQQQARYRQIMATNHIYISRARVEMLGLEWKKDF